MAVSANRLELLQIADAVAREKSIDKQIVISADKVVSRGERIRDVEFADEPPSAEVLPGPGARRLEAGE